MTIFFSFFFFLNRPKQLIELRRNPQGTIEKRGVRSTVKPQLPGKYGGGGGSGGKQNKGASQNRESSLHHKSKTRNAKLRKELRNLDDQIQVKQQTQFSFLFFSFFFRRSNLLPLACGIAALLARLAGVWPPVKWTYKEAKGEISKIY